MASLAETLRQAGYVTPQGVTGPNAPLARQLKNYVTNVIPTAAQNLAQQRADIDASLTMGDQGIQVGDREAFERQMAQVPNLMGLTAYHGTPHTIKGKFDISKVGTGEGAQAYGHGMYFAEAPQVAETYRRAGGGLEIKYGKPLEEIGINPEVTMRSMDFDANPLNQGLGRIAKSLRTTALDYPDVPVNQSLVKEHFDEYIRLLDDKYPKDAAQKKALQDLVAKEGYPDINFGGNLYKVDIPDEYIPKMIEWDKPFTQQPQNLQDIFAKVNPIAVLQKDPSNEFTRWLRLPSTSKNLQEMGYKGIKYKDAGSRGEGTKTFNYVVFDPTDVKILEQNSKPMTRKEIIEQELKKVVE
jgi:hypothetical protein